MAHPVRLRILSLTTAEPMSAAEIAEQLGIAHASASYHARQLVYAGLLQVDESGDTNGRPAGRPPVRYRYFPSLSDHLDRSQGQEALWAATSQEIARRLRQRTRHRVGADAEVWLTREDFETVCHLAQQLSDLIHSRAQRPGATNTTHGSVSILVFEVENDR